MIEERTEACPTRCVIEQSNLKLIAEDFRILARVTNAIFLHNAALNRQIQVDDVVSELFQISKERFNAIINVDVKTAIPEIKRMKKNKWTPTHNSQNFTSYLMPQISKIYSDLPENIKKLKKVGSISSDELLIEAAAVRTKDIFNTTCSRLDFENMKKFRMLFAGKPDNYQIPENNEIEKILKTFKSQSKKVIECMKGLKDLEVKLRQLSIIKAYDRYKTVQKVKKIVMDFEIAQNSAGLWGNALDTLKSYFNSTNDIASSSILGTNATQFLEKMSIVMDQVNQSVWTTEYHTYDYTDTDLTFTAGFRDSSDLLKVFQDLRSPWFQKKIARGASTAKLIKALQPYRNISQMIINLETEWNLMMDFSEQKIDTDVLNGVSVLKNIKTFAAKSTKHLKLLENIKGKIIQCQSFGTKVFDSSAFIRFEKEQQPASVSEELNHLRVFSENVTSVTTTFGIHKVLESSKILAVAECFRDHVDELKETKQILEIQQHILNFPKNYIMDEIIKYLKKLSKVRLEMKNIGKLVLALRKVNQNQRNKTDNHVLTLKNSKSLSENLGQSTKVLEDLEEARRNREEFRKNSKFSSNVVAIIGRQGLADWMKPMNRFDLLLKEADQLDREAKESRNATLIEMTDIFEKATKIHGIVGSKDLLNKVFEELEIHYPEDEKDAMEFFQLVRNLDLDFSKHQARLKNVRVTVTSLKQYFDEIFGHIKPKTVTIEIKPAVSWIVILSISIGFFFFVIIGIFAVYGLTESGRTKYKNWYLYYFGKHADFEKRWRYSNFMDTTDGKNALLDAVREGNRANLLKVLKNGAYIDAYNKFGNTSLHVATKFAHPDLVELLIKYGADRSLLNYKNRTPVQMIPHDYKTAYPERIEKYEQIMGIYEKYEKKSFRMAVPREFPDSSFHIWMDDATDEKLCNKFMDKFRAITSDEALPTTTHCVVRVDTNGILETSHLDLFMWIFHGVIIVKEQWMTDCLENEKVIMEDEKYLVEKVKFNGVVYNSILPWTEYMAKGEMPYLIGVFVAVTIPDYKNLLTLSTIVTNQGGVMMSTFPLKEQFNRNSHPYLHAHLGPLFLIHDGTIDLSVYKNDKDKMYTLFTEEEFIVFMLKRNINRDNRENPIPVMINDE
ncbi:hypothetical protein GCK72_019020 [Caenorhabditis remanei]|uniref:BRCT domain-containing protein n=1 Tax=Caenorhabditis remanei TaxID=31234 RepID=A0A6A5GCV4_CAERE|nr:hypothetical protein GCK72_019020 [Caenorhabditis remanei]KAF1752465.1 hypothetical protein GCK72_019020 [Caenorhabditis remanei]